MAIKKSQTQQPVQEEDFPEEEEDFPEDDNYDSVPEIKPAPAPVRRAPNPPMQVERTNKFAPQPKPVPENRFVAIHSPQVDGILDRRTNKLVTQDIMEVLAEVLSSLGRIEESLG